MNEAERCDRISLMHAGKVLAVGAPQELVKERGSDSLGGHLRRLSRRRCGHRPDEEGRSAAAGRVPKSKRSRCDRQALRSGRLWAYARRETVELLRDPIRLAFALVGPIILMLAFGYGISFDIENLETAAFDQDDTPESRAAARGFRRLALFLCAAADHVGGARRSGV